MRSERWKDIAGFTGKYQVSDLGRVRSYARGRNGTILKHSYDRSGYHRVGLSICRGKVKWSLVHRLVLTTFVGAKVGMQVNHIDGNKDNNTLQNLEWCTQSENMKHAYRLGLEKPCDNGFKKSIRVWHNNTLIGTYTSLRGMCRELHLDRSGVHRSLKNSKLYHGYKFELV